MIVEAIVGAVTAITLGALALTNAIEKRSHARDPRERERSILQKHRDSVQKQLDGVSSYEHGHRMVILDRLKDADRALLEFERRTGEDSGGARSDMPGKGRTDRAS